MLPHEPGPHIRRGLVILVGTVLALYMAIDYARGLSAPPRGDTKPTNPTEEIQ